MRFMMQHELREQFARAAVKLWFLFFAALAKAAASFTECTSGSFGEGRHWVCDPQAQRDEFQTIF